MVVRRDDGDVLALERSDVPNAWQLPQGGVDIGETPLQAAWRELDEETGLRPPCVELVGELPEWIAYEWPAAIRRNAEHGQARIGQVQRWFVFRFLDGNGCAPSPDLEEFIAWKWMTPAELLAGVADFRRDAYRRALSLVPNR